MYFLGFRPRELLVIIQTRVHTTQTCHYFQSRLATHIHTDMITESTLIIDKSVSLLSQYDPGAPKSISLPVSVSSGISVDLDITMNTRRSQSAGSGTGSSRGSRKQGSRKGSSRGRQQGEDNDTERPMNPAVAAELENDLQMTPVRKHKPTSRPRDRSKRTKAAIAAAKLAEETEQAVLAHIPGGDDDGDGGSGDTVAMDSKTDMEAKKEEEEGSGNAMVDDAPKYAPPKRQRSRRKAPKDDGPADFIEAMRNAAYNLLPGLIAKDRADAPVEVAAPLEVAEDVNDGKQEPEPAPAPKQRKRKSSAKKSTGKSKAKRRKVAKETKEEQKADDGDDGKMVAVSYPAAVVLLPKKAKRHHVNRDSLSNEMLRRNINKPAVHKLKQLGSIPRWEGECAMLTRMLVYSITSTYVHNASQVLYHSKRRKLTSKAIVYAAETNGQLLYNNPDERRASAAPV